MGDGGGLAGDDDSASATANPSKATDPPAARGTNSTGGGGREIRVLTDKSAVGGSTVRARTTGDLLHTPSFARACYLR